MSSFFDQDPERLLADSRWIRRLAVPLVGDEELAADLTQETWLVALRKRRPEGYPSRSWLARVLRNVAWKRRRGDARRERRERDVHADRAGEPSPSPQELICRAETQQRLARAVLELEEPLLSTLLLRFFEDLPGEEVAKRMGVATDTVRSRVRRGVGLLRTRLQDEDGEEWSLRRALLLPLSTSAGAAGKTIALGVPVKLGAKCTAGVLVVALGWGGWTTWTGRGLVPAEPPKLDPVELTMREATHVAEGKQKAALTVPSESMRVNADAASGALNGRMVFVYPDGRRIADAGGWFQLRAKPPGESEDVFAVEVRRGTWTCTVVPGSQLVAEAVVMEHEGERRTALVDPLFSDVVPEAGLLHWEVELQPVVLLHVTDSLTGTELSDVQVLADARHYPTWPLVLDEARSARVRHAGQSPLLIPFGDPMLASEGLWVGAADHGWERLRLEPGRDHESWVELPAAGELEILFTGPSAVADAELVLLRLDGRKGIRTDEGDDWEGFLGPSADTSNDRLLLTGLPAGLYTTILQLRPFHATRARAVRLGETPAQVVAGERTTVYMDRAELEPRPQVDLRAEVLIPAAWEVDEFRLTLDPIDVGPTETSSAHVWTQEDLPADSNGVRRFELASMPTGRYQLEFLAYPVVTHREVVRVEGEPCMLSFHVPPPVEVRAQAVDAATRTPLAITQLLHGQGPLPDVSSERAFYADCDTAIGSGRVAFRAPEGPLRVIVTTADGRRAEVQTKAVGPHQDLVVPVP